MFIGPYDLPLPKNPEFDDKTRNSFSFLIGTPRRCTSLKGLIAHNNYYVFDHWM